MFEQLVAGYLTSLTYLAIVVIPIISSLGFPFAEELILLGSGYLAFAGVIRLDLGILFCLIGIIAGDNVAFLVARQGGKFFHFLLPKRRLKKAERFFYRHGAKAVFLARFLIGPRFWMPLIAGASGMRWKKFLLYNTLGAVIVVPMYLYVGYLVGLNLDQIINFTHQLNDFVMLSLLLLFFIAGVYVCLFRKQVRKKIREGNFVDYWLEKDEPYQVVTLGNPETEDARKYIAKIRKLDGKVNLIVGHMHAGCVRKYTKLKKWISLRNYHSMIKRLSRRGKLKIEEWE